MRNSLPDSSPTFSTLDDDPSAVAGATGFRPSSHHSPGPTESLVPPLLLGIIRQWSGEHSLQNHLQFLVKDTEIQSIEILSTNGDLSEYQVIHSSSPDQDEFFARHPKLTGQILSNRLLKGGKSSNFSKSASSNRQVFVQVSNSFQKSEFLMILIEGPSSPEDPFYSTTCHIAATLLLNETTAERSIAALKRSERMLQQSQRLANMGQLTSGVAHDFNNLLVVIQGHLTMIEGECDGNDELRESVDRISSATQRAVELSRQLLSLGKEQDVTFQSCDLNETIRRFERLIARMLEENIEVTFDLSDDTGIIEADTGLLTQILMNLVVNARDAMPQGGSIFISTECIPADESSPDATSPFVSLKVKDSGSGIPKDHLARIFEPFFSTKDKKGTGLGLANVAAIMRQHGGKIDVSSEEGKGTEFELLFPQKSRDLLPSERDADDPVPEKPNKPTQKASFKGTHVLLVEDEQSVRKLVRKLLEMIGCTVTESPSGKDALERWPTISDEISLIVSDVMMPGGVSGWELARQIHKMDPQLGILLTSGYNERPEDHGLEGVSEVSFLQKPYDLGKLKEELHTLSLAS